MQRDEVQNNALTANQRTRTLLKFLDAQIKTDETYFHTFVGILRNEPAYSVLVKKLETAYDSEFVCFVPPLTYRPLPYMYMGTR